MRFVDDLVAAYFWTTL